MNITNTFHYQRLNKHNPILSNKLHTILNLYDINDNKFIEKWSTKFDFLFHNIQLIEYNNIRLSLDEGIEITKYFEYKWIMNIFIPKIITYLEMMDHINQINYRENTYSCSTAFLKTIKCHIFCYKMNLYILKASHQLKNECNEIYIDDEINEYYNFIAECQIHYELQSTLPKIIKFLDEFIYYSNQYEKLVSEKQKIYLLVMSENYKLNPSKTNVSSIMNCNDLVRFIGEYI